MRFLVLFLLLITANIFTWAQTTDNNGTAPNSSSTTYTRPVAGDRFKKYVKGTIGPTSLIGPVFSATFKQIRNSPEEWGRTSKGFGKRLADSFGRHLISQTITYGLDEALKLDSHFYKSQKKDFKSKLSNAVLSAVTARTASGRRVIGVPKIIGSYSAAIIANETWKPNRYDYKDGLRDGTISIATRIGVNLIREFVFK